MKFLPLTDKFLMHLLVFLNFGSVKVEFAATEVTQILHISTPRDDDAETDEPVRLYTPHNLVNRFNFAW